MMKFPLKNLEGPNSPPKTEESKFPQYSGTSAIVFFGGGDLEEQNSGLVHLLSSSSGRRHGSQGLELSTQNKRTIFVSMDVLEYPWMYEQPTLMILPKSGETITNFVLLHI